VFRIGAQAAVGVVPAAGGTTAAAVTVAPARNCRRFIPAQLLGVSLAHIGPLQGRSPGPTESVR
jgi:hypothetical protein